MARSSGRRRRARRPRRAREDLPGQGRGRRGRRRGRAASRLDPYRAAATSAKSGAAAPGDAARSRTITSRASASAERSAAAGNGLNDTTRTRPTGSPVVAQLVDDVLRGSGGRAHRDERRARRPRARTPRTRGYARPVSARQLLRQLGQRVARRVHGDVEVMPELEVVVGHRERPLRGRPRRRRAAGTGCGTRRRTRAPLRRRAARPAPRNA